MPKHAQDALIRRLEASGALDQLNTDARVLFRKRLYFDPLKKERPGQWVQTPLQIGAVTVGFLSIRASKQNERNNAYLHWLEMACKVFAHEFGSPHPHVSDVLPAKITLAARLVREHFREKLSLGDVAKEVELSRERLSRLFHESLGITFSDYLCQVRLGHARKLLYSSGESVTEIAYASGFQSLSQFNRSFRSVEGLSPTQYRKKKNQPAA